MKNKRSNMFVGIVLALIFIILIFIVILGISVVAGGKEKVKTANEKYDVDYKVYLKKNDYYQDQFLDKGRSYVTSIIDYIDTNFIYHYALGNDKILNYTYKIDANIVISEQGNVIYDKKYNLLDEKDDSAVGQFDISENVKLDYQQYDRIAQDFINEYGISNLTSVLNVNMYVKVDNDYEDTVVMSMPLDVKTIYINLSNNPKKESNIIKNSTNHTKDIVYIVLYSILEMILIVILVVYFVVNKKNNAEYIYASEINKIKKKYGAYIQEVYYTFDLTGYKMIRVREFVNLLDIMDIINSPILMIENSKKNGCFFIVLTNTNFIYVYGVKMEEIKKKIANKKLIR